MPNASGALLQCHDLSAAYGGGSQQAVLEHVSLEVDAGETVGLLGPNGFGKSSTLKAIQGNLAILHGSVRFDGCEINGLSPERIAAQGLRWFPQGGRVFADMTVEENLAVAASRVPGKRALAARQAYEWFPELASRAASRAGLLSGGQRQMLSLSMVLIYMFAPGPVVFLLDEPSGSLDPVNRGRLAEILRQALHECHKGVLVAEENAVFAKGVCHRYYRFTEPGVIERVART